MTRGQKVVNNIISNIAVQIVVAMSGLIIPRFILSAFGSTTNGMVNSISQFLTYAGLVEMGIGNASIVVLYEPIAQKDNSKINRIMSSVRKKYLISGCLYTILVTGLAFIYPLCISGQMDYWFVFSMVEIIACTSIIDFFIIGKYKVWLMANQQNYIINFTKALATIVLTVASCIILVSGGSVILVKIITALIHLCEALFIKEYVRYQYSDINYHVSDYIKLEQQKNTLIHQLCSVITYNTDLVILTLFVSDESLKEVSVYSVYALAFSLLNNGMSCFTTGIESTFGDMVAKKEIVKLRKCFEVYKLGYMYITCLLYSCFFALILPFVRCYTQGVTDIDYIRMGVGILFGINGLLANLKDSHGIIIRAYGHYRQTQALVVSEAVVNIMISMMLVHSFGIIGVLTGTVFAHLITGIGLPWYTDRYLLGKKYNKTFRDNLINIIFILILALIEINWVYDVSDWKSWLLSAIGILVVNTVILGIINAVIDPENFKLGIEYINRRIKRKDE